MFVCGAQALSWSQTKGDSLLMKETTLSRPIFLHKNQVRVTSGYEMAIINRRFLADGSAIKLSDINLSGIRHSVPFELKYGLTDFLQVDLAINHRNQILREGSDQIIVIDPSLVNPPLTEVYRVTEKIGFDDLMVNLAARVPFKTNRWDIGISVGLQTPTMNIQTPQPNHEVITTPDSRRFNFRNQGTWSNSIPTVRLGGIFKFRQPKWGITLTTDYRHGLKEGTNRFWTYQLTNNNFQYSATSYAFQAADFVSNQAQLEYQITSWFNAFFNITHFTEKNGWVKVNQTQRKVSDEEITQAFLGFELLATHRLWIRQQFGFSTGGKNSDAPIFFGISISYNSFIK